MCTFLIISKGPFTNTYKGGWCKKRGPLKFWTSEKEGLKKIMLILPLKIESIWLSVGLQCQFSLGKRGTEKNCGPKRRGAENFSH